MNKIKQSQSIAIFVITLALIITAASIYTLLLFNTVTENTMKTVDEIANHDVQSIDGTLDVQYDKLASIIKRVETLDIKNMRDMQKRLCIEADSSEMYDSLYLLDEDGVLYGSLSFIFPPEKHAYNELFANGRDRFVMLYDDANGVLETMRESLIFGMKIPETTLGGKKIIAILGRSNPAVLRDQLLTESFQGQGKASVINSSGYYIVTDQPVTDLASRENFFKLLATYKIHDGLSLDDVKEKVYRAESFIIRCTTPNNEELVLSFWPIRETDWAFIMSVPSSVIQEQFQQLIVMNIGMLIVVILAITIMMILINYFLKRSIRADAEAKARADFLSNMSHEIRTPLNGIIGLNHLMQHSLNEPEAMKTYMTKSAKAANYLLSLVNDILDMSKLQAGKVDLEIKPFDLNEAITNVCDIQKESIEMKGIKFISNIELPYNFVIGDEVRISQVVMNILSNAVKFTPRKGTITLNASQALLPGDSETRTVIQISDTGCGMTSEFQKHIFDMFTQERNSNTSSQKGTGLGMSISYLLIEQMGGRLTVNSKLNYGSQFSITLNQTIATEEEIAELKKEQQDDISEATTSIPPEDVHILVAEDNELNADIISSILSKKGYKVTLAADGKEAVDIFNRSEISEFPIILMDVQMPIMDGYEASVAIRNLNRADAKTVRIIACTASTLIEDREHAIESGMNDFLPKPIQVQLLMEKIQEVLRSGGVHNG